MDIWIKAFLLILGTPGLLANAYAVDCVPDSITLTHQVDVDNFQTNYGPCDTVTGTLSIQKPPVVLTPTLTDLSGLSDLVRVGNLNIFALNLLTNLDGLSGLETIDGFLAIRWTKELIHIDGLTNVSSIGGYIHIGVNTELQNLHGLSGLSGATGSYLAVNSNPSLTSLEGLSGLTEVNGYFSLSTNGLITHLDELSNLTTVDGEFWLAANENLANLDGLSNLNSIGLSMHIESNPVLSNVDGLASLESVGGDVWITANTALEYCNALYVLLDDIDDALLGPGPGAAGIPDIAGELYIESNLPGCNSRAEILERGPLPIFSSGFEN